MANSFQLALRGGIMIVTMVAIPLLAIFGKQIPELIEGIYRGNTKTDEWQTRPTQPVAGSVSNAGSNQLALQQQRSDLAPAPAFQPGTAGSLNPAYGQGSKNLEPPALATNVFQAAQPLPLSPANTNPANSSLRGTNLGQALPPSSLRDPQVNPAALTRPAPPTDLNSVAFQRGQQRLRELGASYFKLETTGEATERYRAVCQIAAPNQPVQNFTSIHTDALTALNDVISQIEGKRETAQAFSGGAWGIQR
jgi:hypothetical protein